MFETINGPLSCCFSPSQFPSLSQLICLFAFTHDNIRKRPYIVCICAVTVASIHTEIAAKHVYISVLYQS